MRGLFLVLLLGASSAFAESCEDFANKIFKFYDLGSVGHPSSLVKSGYKFDKNKKSHLPVFDLQGKKGIHVEGITGSVLGNASKVEEENSWRMVVNSNHVLEREKRRKFFPAGTWPEGPIRYVFYFQKEGENCVLQKLQFVRTGVVIKNEEADFKTCQKIKKSTPDKYYEYIMLHLCEQYFEAPKAEVPTAPLTERDM